MLRQKAYKFCIYPTDKQKCLLQKTFGCVRFLYNKMLADDITEYENSKKRAMKTPATYKSEFAFLKEVDSLALCNAQLHLDRAFANFFRDKKIGFPKCTVRRASSRRKKIKGKRVIQRMLSTIIYV